jgi:hypothetical protein
MAQLPVETFELYFNLGEQAARFEPLTCRREDVIRLALDRLSDHGASTVEVRQANVLLFDLAR